MSVFAYRHSTEEPAQGARHAVDCRLDAALAFLDRPNFPDPGRHLPERIESQHVLKPLAEIKAEERATRTTNTIDANAPHGTVGRGANRACRSMSLRFRLQVTNHVAAAAALIKAPTRAPQAEG